MAMLSRILPPTYTQHAAKPLQRLASGRRLNSFQDDAAGFAIATGMDTRVRSRRVAAQNIEDGMHVTQFLDQALDLMADRLVRIRELALTSLNDTTPRSYKLDQLFRELWKTRQDIDHIARSARKAPSRRSLRTGFDLEVGVGITAHPDSILTLTVPSVWSGTLTDASGNRLQQAWIGNDARSRQTLDIVDGGLQTVNQTRAALGAFQNRLAHALSLNDVGIQTTEAARSGIEDADLAVETVAMVQGFAKQRGREGLGALVRDLDLNAVQQLLDL